MKVLALKGIIRKDVPIYYRRLYSGVLALELLGKTVERNIEFLVENMPTGQKNINVTFAEPVDYPLVPLMKEVKQFIDQLDTRGGLPV